MIGILLAIAFPAVSSADQSGAQQLEAIRRRMESGLGLFVGGKAAEAAAEFDAGFAEHPYSAFLFNAGVCYQKLGQNDKALERYRDYLKIDPNAPDADAVKTRIATLEAEQAPPPPPPVPSGQTGVQPPPPPPPQPPSASQVAATEEAMRSLVVVETEPPGAPLKVYLAADETTPAFQNSGANAGWKLVSTATSPTSLSLAVGRYHIVIDKFRDFNVSETDIHVSAGHVFQFKANLSQGAFMSFLRVSANVTGAHIWIDDPKKTRPEWGTTPYGELVPSGDHDVLVEIPGFQPLATKVKLEHGEQKELEVRLARDDYGILRIDSDAPDAKIRIDQEPRGIWQSGTPPLDVQVPAGKHLLTVDGTGRKTLSTMVDVPRGQVLPLHAKLIPTFPRGAAWTQAIVSAAFIGAGAYFGTESNKLYDQAHADRQNGVLDSDDNRISRGRIYAVGADCGFVLGAGLAALSAYSFVRDPLPPSSVKLDKPTEFDDPLNARPTASVSPPRRTRVAVKKALAPGPRIAAAPAVFGSGGGLVIGGSF